MRVSKRVMGLIVLCVLLAVGGSIILFNNLYLKEEVKENDPYAPVPEICIFDEFISGDMISVKDDNGILQVVKLLDIKAPEMNTEEGKKVTEELQQTMKPFIFMVMLEQCGKEKDKQGRLLRFVHVVNLKDSTTWNLNVWLTKKGYAKYSMEYGPSRYHNDFINQ